MTDEKWPDGWSRRDFETWWDAYRKTQPSVAPPASGMPERDRKLARAAYGAAMSHSQAYLADDEVYPKRVSFANGRVVAYKLASGRAFLVVGMVPVEVSSELRCPNAADSHQAFDTWFNTNATSGMTQSSCWGTWTAAIAWVTAELEAVNAEDRRSRAGFDNWFRSSTDERRCSVWSFGWKTWQAAIDSEPYF